MATPYEPFTDIPAVTPATLPEQVKGWFYTRRKQVQGLAVTLGPRSDFSRDTMAALAARLTTAESRTAQGTAPATVVADFQGWLDAWNDNGAWDYYVTWQKQQDQDIVAAQAAAAAAQAVTDARNQASQAARAQAQMRAGG